jgi:hypothetical protein
VGGVPELLSSLINDTLLVEPGDIKILRERIVMFSSLQREELHDQIVYLSNISEHLLNKLHESSKLLRLIIAEE